MRTQKMKSGRWPDSHTAAIVVTDIEDSTGWTVRLGDEGWLATLLEHRGIVRRRVVEHGGQELATTGDGFVLIFPDVEAAVRCIASIRVDHRTCAGPTTRLLRVRVGLHVGTIRLAPDDTWVGRDLHFASRVASAAEGGEILVSKDSLRDQRGVEAQVSGVRRAALRGFPGEHALLTLDWN